jgi:hypothetical protein
MNNQKNFSDWAEYGIYCIPLRNKSKQPLVKWKKYQDTPPPASLLENWDRLTFGMAVILGKVSNVIAIDIDDIALAHLVPESPVKKSAARGETRFFKYNGEPNRNYKGLEIKSTGTYTVIPPSIHPEGMPYTWTAGDLTEELFPLPDGLIESLDKHFHYAPKQSSSDGFAVCEDDIVEALKFIPCANATYEQWLKVGMAIHSALGFDGLSIFDEWSKTDAKRYDGAKQIAKKWESFSEGGVSIATVFDMASKNGFGVPEVFIEKPKAPKEKKEAIPQFLPDDLIDSAPESLRILTNWIFESGYIPNKLIAFSSALSILSAFKLFRVTSDSGLKPNLYILAVGGSGTGKTHALNAITMFFDELKEDDRSCSSWLASKPVSDAALERMINDRKRIILWDEIGLTLKSLKNLSSYQSRVLDVMTQIYSMTNTTYIGNEYGNHDNKRPTIKVLKPQISCYATSTYDPFFESLENSEIASGKYQRWLPFLCPEHIELDAFGSGNLQITPQIKELQKTLKKRFPMRYAPGSLSQSTFLFKDAVIPFTPEAKAFLNNIGLELHKKAASSEHDYEKAFSARIIERTKQLALVVCDNPREISLPHVEWAYDVVTFLINSFMEHGIKQRFSRNQIESDSNRILNYIKNRPDFTTLEQISNRFRSISRQNRQNLIDDLIESGLIKAEKVGSTRKAIRLSAL